MAPGKQVVFVLVCVSLFVLGLQSVVVVNANMFKAPPLPAVHISSDGAVSSSSALIHRSGNVYTFTGNWSTCVLEVERSNIVIDGAGFFISGHGQENGIILNDVRNVLISDVNIADTNIGIYLESCSNVTIDGCSVRDSNRGVYLNGSKNNVILGNKLSFNYNGIYLDYSGSNVLRNNSIQVAVTADYGLDFMVTGESLADYMNDVDASNLVNGEPIIYWAGRQDAVAPQNASYVALVNCRGIIVENQQISKSQGILVAWTTNSTVRNNVLQGVANSGIYVLYSSNITLSGNQIWRSSDTYTVGGNGVCLVNSQFVTIANNQVSGNRNAGITCTNSSKNQLIGNIIIRNRHNGISLLSGSDANLILMNYLSDHMTDSQGAIFIEDSRNNLLVANNLTDNGCWGIQLRGKQGNNTFYANNFVNNSYKNTRRTPDVIQVSTPGTDIGNFWDNGSMGNYWSDYHGSDANSDGIGDSQYYINPANHDNYPLMSPVATSKVPWIASILPSSMLSSPEFPVQQLSVIAVVASVLVVAVVAVQVYWKKRIR